MSPFVTEITEAVQALAPMKGYSIGTPRQHPNAAIAIIPVNHTAVEITLREWQADRSPEYRTNLLSSRIATA